MPSRLPVLPWLVCVSVLAGVSPALLHADEPTPQQLEFFENKIRPLLAANCHKCHHADTRQRGGLSLESREAVLRGGDNGPAIVAGDPDRSRLIQAVRYVNPDLQMPPRSKLSAEQIAALTTWVKMGAPWPKTAKVVRAAGTATFDLAERSKHWSFQPVRRPPLPPVQNQDWPLSPIDHFILAKLEQAGLTPNPPADKRTLLRRVYFDLIGLPPTPTEIDAFLGDPSPQAFEKVVDHLLDSPHYGERWGRHWLDLMRFAETAGHEFDFEMPDAWRYRDYVIRAFNADVPYDQLVREHIAGDLLPQPRRHSAEHFNESILATGFWFLGEAKHSPVDIKGDQADRLDNQIDVFGKTFLGLTLACARCHDHKFDPIRTRDYYSMMGYLQSSRYQRAFIDDPTPTLQGIDHLHALKQQLTQLAVPSTRVSLQARLQQLTKYLRSGEGSTKAPHPQPLSPEYRGEGSKKAPRPGTPGRGVGGEGDWHKRLQREAGNNMHHPLSLWAALTPNGQPLPPEQFQSRRQELLQQWQSAAKLPESYQLFEDFRDGYRDWFVTGQAFGSRPSRTEATFQSDSNRPIKGLIGANVAHSGLVSGKLQGALRSQTFAIPKKYIHYRVRGQGTTINLIVDGFQQIRNPIYGGLTFAVNHGDTPRWHTQDVSMWTGHRAYVEALDDGPGFIGLECVVFSDSPAPPPAPSNGLLTELLADPRFKTPEQLAAALQQIFQESLTHWEKGTLAAQADCADRVALLNGLLTSEALASLPADSTTTAVQGQKLAELLRQYQQTEAQLPQQRRALAMTDGTPINERVFIRGNHKTLGDEVPRRFLEVFVGEAPAVTTSSGRLELARQMVEPDNPLTARVMVNRLWQHHFGAGLVRSVDNFGVLGQPPTHPELLDWLASEFVQRGWSLKQMHRLMLLSRTYQMASTPQAAARTKDPENKLLHRMTVQRLEGEIIRDALLAISGRLNRQQFGPGVLPHLTPFMSGRGRPGRSGPLDGEGRRSIYINVRRNFLTPMFLVFDYPVPFSTMGRRSVSNVPAQALTMMNNPLVLQQAELWSKRVLAEPNLSPPQRLESMYLTALGRPPSADEVQQMLAFLQEQSRIYGHDNAPQAWRDLCHVLVNLKEFIYVN